jgi:hypothetical protein
VDAEQATSQPARLLAARSELAYTHVPALALRDEPESVDEETQRELTRRARREASLRLLEDWGRARRAIASALEEFKTGRLDRRLQDHVRAVERALERVDRELARGS